MAALVGASLIAISAFYIHKRSVDQVLQRLIEIRRKPSRNAGNRFVIEYDDEAEEEAEAEEEEEERDDDGGYGSDEEMTVDREMWGRSLSRSLDENMLRSYIISASLPNVASRNDWLDEDPKLDQPPVGLRAHGFAFSLDRPSLIPQGLPPLRLHHRDGMPYILLFSAWKF
jgi:AMP deaminase